MLYSCYDAAAKLLVVGCLGRAAQVTFRINLYNMSADYYQALDQSRYQTPIQLATGLGSLLSMAVPLLDTQSLVRALTSG